MHRTTRRLRRLLTRAAAMRCVRCAAARTVVNPTGPFTRRVKPSARLYQRHHKHPTRALAEHFA